MPGRIPQQFIDELLMRIDIVDVIDTRVPLRKMGKEHKACCPFHEERTPSFTVSADKQFYHCFGCGAHGTAIGFLMEYERMSFPEAVRELASQAGLTVPVQAQSGGVSDAAGPDLEDILRQADRYFRRQLREHPQGQKVIEYLKKRGVSGEIAQRFGIGFAPPGWDNLLHALGTEPDAQKALLRAGMITSKDGGSHYDRFRNRLMFPIHDYRGRLVGFGGRVLDDSEPKYLNSPETPLFHKGREMYGLYGARDAFKREQRALVVEGYMDVIALAQAGIDFAVATLGTATTREHLERLFRFVPEVVFCFDGDRAGREAAWRALENALPVMYQGRQVSFLFLPEGEDPDSLVRREGREAFLGRLPGLSLPEYMFNSLIGKVDLSRMDGRARLVELARPCLSKVPPGALHQMMLERLAEASHMDAEKLSTLVKGVDSIPSRARPPGGTPSAAWPKQTRSVMRTAIALLLQKPGLAQLVQDSESFAHMDLTGLPLFRALVDLLRRQPGLNTAAILENFRGSEHILHLEKLAIWTHPVLDQDVETEFLDIVEWLRKKGKKQRTEHLLSRQRLGAITPAEQAELNNLLNAKRELKTPPVSSSL